MLITKEHLRAIAPHANEKILTALPAALNHWLPIYGLTDKRVVQMFLAQGAEETDGFKTFQEYASGAAYEGRKDLGNTRLGDGVLFKGRGVFMDTGRANYEAAGNELGLDLVNHPELLLIADNAVHAACAYWSDHNLSQFALVGDITTVTRRINGGLNGLSVRIDYWRRCQLVIVADLEIPDHVEALGAVQPKAPQIAPQPQSPVSSTLPSETANPSATPERPPALANPAPILPAPVGNWQFNGVFNMLTGSKTYMGVSAILTWVLSMVMNGSLPVMPAIGAGIVALTLAALRHGISASVVQIIDTFVGALDSNQNALVAALAVTVDNGIKKGLAEKAAADAAAVAAAPAKAA